MSISTIRRDYEKLYGLTLRIIRKKIDCGWSSTQKIYLA